jgi:carbon monoxide dehydrogenase subunit G
MIQFSNKLMIQLGTSAVFDFLNKMENFPTWNYAVSEIKKVSNDIGVDYRLFRNQMGPRVENIKIAEVIEGRKLTLEIKGGWFPYTMTYILTPSTKGTILENEVTINQAGMSGVAAQLFKGQLKQAVGKNLQVLKKILENNTEKIQIMY